MHGGSRNGCEPAGKNPDRVDGVQLQTLAGHVVHEEHLVHQFLGHGVARWANHYDLLVLHTVEHSILLLPFF